MSFRLFVTGTDTDIGKTYISVALLKALNQAGLSTAAIKPVSCGGMENGEWLVDADPVLLRDAASLDLPMETVVPVALATPIAPHIAAEKENRQVTVDSLLQACEPGLMAGADVCLMEGVGGWLVPLNDTETMADFVVQVKAKVVLVVGMKLGCLNHALLTAAAIKAAGVELVGWVANCMAPDMLVRDENIAALGTHIDAPCLGVVGYGDDSLVVDEFLRCLAAYQKTETTSSTFWGANIKSYC
jgi:dethiobiotin synthetase